MTEQKDAGGDSRSRRYHSTLREERAEETRQRIVAAARRLFAARGFGGTTVALIAEHSGVAAPTVYAVFGTKVAIMRELLGRIEGEADAERWRDRIATEPDPWRKLALYAGGHRTLFSSGRDVLGPALAAGGDPSVVELQAQGYRSAREWLGPILEALERAGALPPNLDREEAVDRAWMLTGPELYFRATDSCGWSDAAYERWLTELLRSQLLRPGDTGPAGPAGADTGDPSTDVDPSPGGSP